MMQGYANEGVRCWSGNDDEAHEGRHNFGSQGVISVTSNLLPGLFSRLMRTPNQELMDSLQDLIAWLFCEPNPIGINTAMVRSPRLCMHWRFLCRLVCHCAICSGICCLRFTWTCLNLMHFVTTAVIGSRGIVP